MSHHRVDLDQLDAAIGKVEAFERSLRQAMQDAERQVDELHQTWTGDAAAAHRRAHEHWRAGTATMTDALATMHRIARTAHHNYTDAVEANGQMWRSVQ